MSGSDKRWLVQQRSNPRGARAYAAMARRAAASPPVVSRRASHRNRDAGQEWRSWSGDVTVMHGSVRALAARCSWRPDGAVPITGTVMPGLDAWPWADHCRVGLLIGKRRTIGRCRLRARGPRAGTPTERLRIMPRRDGTPVRG